MNVQVLKRVPGSRRSRIGQVISLVCALLFASGIFVVVLWPTPVDRPLYVRLIKGLNRMEEMGLPALSYASLEASANVALFVPLGFLAARVMSRRYWWLALLLCIILSGAGELAQDRFLPERVGNVEDVLLNAAGALAGVMMGSLPRRGRRRRARRHRGRHRPVALK